MLFTPRKIKKMFPLTSSEKQRISKWREQIARILLGRDKRLLIITGPCSVHDEVAILDYASRLAKLQEAVKDRIFLVMRAYFEKPRTILGWKGFINDPQINQSFKINNGLFGARKILTKINKLGIPIATEFLNPIISQYIFDLTAYGVIGARTVESQIHREMASGLPMPIGFKNSTDGNLENAARAVIAAQNRHAYININEQGRVAQINTKGNKHGHIILRGSSNRPNYYEKDLNEANKVLQQYRLNSGIVIDCSHDNSRKKYELQPKVFKYALEKYLIGKSRICGIMLESNIYDGRQTISKSKPRPQYGISLTDACIGWETTAKLIRLAYAKSAIDK